VPEFLASGPIERIKPQPFEYAACDFLRGEAVDR